MGIFNKLKTFSKGGIHPNPSKLTAGSGIRPLEAPKSVRVLLSQHIGAPARCIVKPGQEVAAGEMIGEANGFVSAPVHSPIAGVVKKIELVRDGQGLWKEAVLIEAIKGDDNLADPDTPILDFPIDNPLRSDAEIEALQPADIIEIVGNAGIVGLGGASFPTKVKLSVPPGKKADIYVINGAECEPYLTCDDALMRSHAKEILTGVRYLMRAVDAPKALVGIEANKPEAIRAMKIAAGEFPEIEIVPVKTCYPQGSEKQLIYALTKRSVPTAGLPIDVGVIVDNVATAFAVERAVRYGEPLTKRVATLTGPDIKGGDFIICTGMNTSDLIAQISEKPENTGKLISGGPMMGHAMSQPDAPMVKSSGGLLILPEDMSKRGEAQPCIRCATCVGVCPMGLEPYLLQTLGEFSLAQDAKENGVLNCLECGCCSYVCPSHRPLLDYIRLAKQQVRKLPKE